MPDLFDPNVEFRISDLLLPGEQIVRLVRFLVSVRHLTALTRSLAALRKEGSSETEAVLILLLHLVGSAKEAADRFRDCDSNGLFDHVETDGEALEQVKADLAIARQAANKLDASSMYSRVLKPVRDSVGYHIDSRSVREALDGLRGEYFRAAEVDPGSTVTSIPLVTSVLFSGLPGVRRRPKAIAELLDELLTVQAALRDLAHDFYLLIVAVSTLKQREAGRQDPPTPDN